MKNPFDRTRAHLSQVNPRPDFSSVTTPAKAAALSDTGKLKRTLLVPLALGGEDAETNTAYVPPAVVVAKPFEPVPPCPAPPA